MSENRRSSTQPEINGDSFKEIRFTVDSALLRELGERLVGKPHIALAELIKNSYDADATKVEISFSPDSISIVDNGHGMDFDEFNGFWMRVGSPHKQDLHTSRKFGRLITGSKGIGRLAVQFLAHRIEMYTVSERDTDTKIEVKVDWDEAIDAGELIDANAYYRIGSSKTSFPGYKEHGTAIILRGLNQVWGVDEITNLAKEIWPLQPPFRSTSQPANWLPQAFDIDLYNPDPDAIKAFEEQMDAVLDLWSAKLNGRLHLDSDSGECIVDLVLQFDDGDRYIHTYSIQECNLHFVEFEIRVYKLEGKQEYGIRVQEARDYFKDFGGVHVYDAGFHLPYYGMVENDWLRIQYDQASRIHRSRLLPPELQTFQGRGLQYLPTLSRVFGIVHVNTAHEFQKAKGKGTDSFGEYLKIQVTRDRLVGNIAYERLAEIVRYAVDYYSVRESARKFEQHEVLRSSEPVSRKFERVEDVLNRYKDAIDRPVYRTLEREVEAAVQSSRNETERMARQAGLLGALATAGMAALAYEHEAKKQNFLLMEIIRKLEKLQFQDEKVRSQVAEITGEIHNWLTQSKTTRALFTTLIEKENRETVTRFHASELIHDISSQVGILLRGIRPNTTRVDPSLLLPRAGYAEWIAIFHNLLLNAVNAMLDSAEKRIDISSKSAGENRAILIQDTGVGVDLATSEELFKPFVRKLSISPERKALGLGGSGLGLTIIRMITDNIGCSASFVEPEEGFSTAFQIRWREL